MTTLRHDARKTFRVEETHYFCIIYYFRRANFYPQEYPWPLFLCWRAAITGYGSCIRGYCVVADYSVVNEVSFRCLEGFLYTR